MSDEPIDDENPPKGYRYVHFMFADTSKQKRKAKVNELVTLVTDTSITHVEIYFKDIPQSYTITQDKNRVEAGMTRRGLKAYDSSMYHDYVLLLPEENVELMVQFCANKLNTQYDKVGFYCFPFAALCNVLTCGERQCFANDEKITCARLVGGALQAGKLVQYTDTQLKLLTVRDIMEYVVRKGAREVDITPPKTAPGVYE